MNELIEKMIEMGMGRLMDESRDEMAMADEMYKADREAEDELEKRYESLDLTREQRIIINDYIACTLKDFAELFHSCQCNIFILFEGIQSFVVNPTL